MPTLQEKIEAAKADYVRAKSQLCSAFASIPDERINWSPSATARTPVQIVAHCAASVPNILDQMDGTPFRIKTTAEADAAFLDHERKFRTRDEVIGQLEDSSEKYLGWLDALTQPQLDRVAEMPFGLGPLPVELWLQAAPAHTRSHAFQLEYIQTIYGDRDWHLKEPGIG